MAPIIQASELVKTYGDVVALDGLDISVEQGTVLAMLGPNGAGKTTAVSILTTLIKPNSGSATVARSLGVNVLEHGINRGKGAALCTGFTHALEGGYDAVLTLDADGQHRPEEIHRILEVHRGHAERGEVEGPEVGHQGAFARARDRELGERPVLDPAPDDFDFSIA